MVAIQGACDTRSVAREFEKHRGRGEAPAEPADLPGLRLSRSFALPETPRGVAAAAEDDATLLRPLPTGLQPRSGPAFFEQQRGPGLG